MGGRVGNRVAPILAALLLGGCFDDFEVPVIVTLAGELVPVNNADPSVRVTGPVRMYTGLGFTELSIEVRDQEPGQRLRWSARSGRCEGSGELLAPPADFPEIQVGEAGGTGGSRAVLDRNVPETAEYAVEVASLEGERLACADLALV